jgi:hypothetical protein
MAVLIYLCVIIIAVSHTRRIHKHKCGWQMTHPLTLCVCALQAVAVVQRAMRGVPLEAHLQAHSVTDDAPADVMCVRPAGCGCGAARDAWHAARAAHLSVQSALLSAV